MKAFGFVFLWIGIAAQLAKAMGLPPENWTASIKESWIRTAATAIKREVEEELQKLEVTARQWN